MKLYKKSTVTYPSRHPIAVYGYVEKRKIDKFNDGVYVFVPIGDYYPKGISISEHGFSIYDNFGDKWEHIPEKLTELSKKEYKLVRETLGQNIIDFAHNSSKYFNLKNSLDK